jgi:hypothetical protein
MGERELVSEKDFEEYGSSFMDNLKQILKPGIGAEINSYLSKNDGSLIYFQLRPGSIAYKFKELEEGKGISEALKEIPQRAFGGDLSGIKFGGTNTIIEGDKIIFIKGGNTKDLWSPEMAKDDSKKLIESIQRK